MICTISFQQTKKVATEKNCASMVVSFFSIPANFGRAPVPRCSPQVIGAVRDILSDLENTLSIELNSVTDNPLIFISDDGVDVVSGGNFHGQYIALPTFCRSSCYLQILNRAKSILCSHTWGEVFSSCPYTSTPNCCRLWPSGRSPLGPTKPPP